MGPCSFYLEPICSSLLPPELLEPRSQHHPSHSISCNLLLACPHVSGTRCPVHSYSQVSSQPSSAQYPTGTPVSQRPSGPPRPCLCCPQPPLGPLPLLSHTVPSFTLLHMHWSACCVSTIPGTHPTHGSPKTEIQSSLSPC
ncbi:hypothetical protein HJG60_010233 [Phyllostomus discolor]|uniref:Uncharacterized protein n=1 Tax=Phyllostomus discolor TaxID=89673 RepID=A0A834ASE6_9CHIR|nr:hypothetical protein HJG60_010233 [Phyllostomus discolor]